ncbi:MAG: hypothetical protein K0R82_2032 [Flavipsychrobacter sp.]|jgi:uncharacterized damage-inducible protein DinB|nr:hypothetical protein [Flavipsychrobacter sp.]
MTAELLKEVKEHSIYRMERNTPRIASCLEQLSEEEVWNRPNDSSNSVGNLILHLCGNITQYIISSIGHVPDNRERDKEFSAKGGFTKAELMQKLDTVVSEAVRVINDASAEELLRIRNVQGYTYSGIGNIIHVTEHYSYHTGQIAFWTKLLKNNDLGFYANINLDIKNED